MTKFCRECGRQLGPDEAHKLRPSPVFGWDVLQYIGACCADKVPPMEGEKLK